jgi:hypothetical protein
MKESMATAPISKSKESTIFKNSTNIQALQGERTLSFPEYLGNSNIDEIGNDFAWMMININSATDGSKLQGDTATGPVVIANTQIGTTMDGRVMDLGSKKDNEQFVDSETRRKYGDDAVSKQTWTRKPGLSRLDRVVILPMPNDYGVDTTIEYDSNATSDGLSSANDFLNSIGSGGVSAAMHVLLSDLATGLVNKGSSALGVGNITSKDRMLARGRIAMNPKKETLFKDIPFRNYRFRYTLAPRSQNESKIIQEIIKTLRYYALPELNETKLYYTFPAEFEIKLMKGSEENAAIPRIAPCVLKNISVNYAPNTTVWGNLPDGFPPIVEMSLDFQELELIDRNRVDNQTSLITSGY